MVIKEVLASQQSSGNFILMRQGLFFRCYNESASLLRQAMGYVVKRKYLKSCGCKVYYVGFPWLNLDKVLSVLQSQGGVVVRRDDNLVELSGLSVVYNEAEMDALAVESAPCEEEGGGEPFLASKILNFNISSATPIECMIFLHSLQKGLQNSVSGGGDL